jgi:hypothetical protein
MMNLRTWLYNKAYPGFECQQCVGQDYWQGCHCAYAGGISPGEGPGRYHLALRWLYGKLYGPARWD